MEMQNGIKDRIYYIDNLRWLMIVFVIIQHLNVTYSSIGSWYYTEPGNIGIVQKLLFGMHGSFMQAYFMGFLFLIAGYFVPGSFDKKGGAGFVAGRLIRLGIPALIFMLILNPLTVIILHIFKQILPYGILSYLKWYYGTFQFVGGSGPLWFAIALLIFSLIYATIRVMFFRRSSINKQQDKNIISNRNIFLLAFIISAAAFLVRIAFPIFGSVMNFQLGFFAQYVILFCAGIIAYRRGAFSKIPYKIGMNWFRVVLIAGIPFWILLIIFGGVIKGSMEFTGGITWQSAAYSFWESFFCIGICLGLIVMFRDKFNTRGRLTKFLSDNAFGVYVFHAPILVFITLLMKDWQTYHLLKFFVAAIIAVPICFCSVYLIRKIPGLNRIFS